MGSGGTQTTTQSLPPWAVPYASGLLAMAQNLMFPGGAPLPAREAVAGFSPDQIQSQNMVERLGGVPVTNGAQGYINWNPANIPQWNVAQRPPGTGGGTGGA